MATVKQVHIEELIDLGGMDGATDSEAVRPLLNYLLMHGGVTENDGDIDALVRNLFTSPQLHWLGQDKIAIAVKELHARNLLTRLEQRLNDRPSVTWQLADFSAFEARAGRTVTPTVKTLLADARARITVQPLVKHDGMAKVGGFEDVCTSISNIQDGGTLRWFAFHGLSESFIHVIQDRARKAQFTVRVMVLDEKAAPELRESSSEKDFVAAVQDGVRRLAAFGQELHAGNRRTTLEVRRYGSSIDEAWLRGMLVTRPDDTPERAAIIVFRVPNGRGVEGERIVLESTDHGMGSLAYLFKSYFDDTWSRNAPSDSVTTSAAPPRPAALGEVPPVRRAPRANLKEIHDIYNLLQSAQLLEPSTFRTLLAGIDSSIVTKLPNDGSAAARALAVIDVLAKLPDLPDGTIPLVSFLSNAALLSQGYNAGAELLALAAWFSGDSNV